MGRNSCRFRSKIAPARVRAHQRIFDFCLHFFTFFPQLVDTLHDKCEGFTLAAFTLFVIFPFTLAFIATICESVYCVEWGGEGKSVKTSRVTDCRIVVYL